MGRVWVFGDSVNTDQIIPGRFNITTGPAALAQGCFVELRPKLHLEARAGDVIVAGDDFGCGSSREHAVIAIQACGIAAVVASSFARIFFRNAINLGLAVLECPEARGLLADGSQASVNLLAGTIKLAGSDTVLQARPLPEFAMRIARHGGILELVRAHGSLAAPCDDDCLAIAPA